MLFFPADQKARASEPPQAACEPVSLRRLPVHTPPLPAGLGFPRLLRPILPVTGPQVLNSNPFIGRRPSSGHSSSVTPAASHMKRESSGLRQSSMGIPCPLDFPSHDSGLPEITHSELFPALELPGCFPRLSNYSPSLTAPSLLWETETGSFL